MTQWKATGNYILPAQQYTDRYGKLVRLSDSSGREYIKVESDNV